MNAIRNSVTRLASGALAVLPTLASAAPSDFKGVVSIVLEILQLLTGVAGVLFLLSFVYGVIRFLVSFEDEHAREEGKRFMVWSFVATAVALTFWGFLTMLSSTFFGTDSAIPQLTPPV